MKKLIILFLAVGLLTTTALTSCKKENAKAPTASSTTKNSNTALMRVVDNNFNQAALTGVSKSTQGFLVFTTQEAYENVLNIITTFTDEQLNGWEDALAFTSAYTAFGDPATYGVSAQDNKNQNFGDPLMLRLLDVSNMVQIEGFVFNVQTDNGYLLEMNQSHLAAHYASLKAGTFDASYMNKMDESAVGANDDDIFMVLRTGVIGINNPGGGTPSAFGSEGDSYNDDLYNANARYRASAKIAYQKAGIYFSLVSELKYTKGTSPAWATKTNIGLTTPTSCNVTPHKRGGYSVGKPGGVYDNKLTWRAYSSTRSLDHFDMRNTWSYYSIAATWRTIGLYKYK
ncbi:MAG: hypothetical protein IT256_06215 [Chitinophagaceae bacterium]|nr:hypothetical protein [Chitinophagaceae bacterium]